MKEKVINLPSRADMDGNPPPDDAIEFAKQIERKAEDLRSAREQRERLNLLRSMPVTEEMFDRIATSLGKPLAPSAQKKLQPIVEKFRHAQKVVIAHTNQEARAVIQRHKLAVYQAVKDGSALPEHRDGDSIEEEYARRRSAANEVKREAAEEAVEYVSAILEDLAKAADEIADRIEDGERDQFLKFNVPYQPSRLALTIRAAALNCRERMPKPGHAYGADPAHTLAGIVKF